MATAKITQEVRARYDFTKEEKHHMGELLAQKISQREDISDEKKAVMSDFKERLDNVAADINRYSKNVNLGYEFRTYRCEVTKDFERKLVLFTEVNTGNLIDSRPFTPQDYQQTFDDEPEPMTKGPYKDHNASLKAPPRKKKKKG